MVTPIPSTSSPTRSVPNRVSSTMFGTKGTTCPHRDTAAWLVAPTVAFLRSSVARSDTHARWIPPPWRVPGGEPAGQSRLRRRHDHGVFLHWVRVQGPD